MNPNELTPLELGQMVLEYVREIAFLGSSNLKPISIDKNPNKDNLMVLPFLFTESQRERRRKLEAQIPLRNVNAYKDFEKSQLYETLYGFLVDKLLIASDRKRVEISLKKNFTLTDRDINFIKMMLSSFKVKTLSAGNCGMLSFFAFFTLLGLGYTNKIEFVSFNNVNHGCIVINRPSDSLPNDLTTWGKNAIIIDAWINKAYPATDFFKIWKEDPWGAGITKLLEISILFNDIDIKKAAAKFKNEWPWDESNTKDNNPSNFTP